MQDKIGLVYYQRRLAFSLSLGAANLIELHFHKLQIIKEGTKIDHTWFKRSSEKIFDKLQNQITCQIDSVEKIQSIVNLTKQIEAKRDAPVEEKILQDKINLFFQLKDVVKC